VINQRIGTAFHTMIGAINGLWADGVRSWLKPGFDEKLFADLTTNAALMRNIIDRFNTMVSGLPAIFPNVIYMDVRRELSSVIAGDVYQDSWTNELHPTERV
jgi:hypothetical protein